jgi:hypothetical protein
MLASFIVEYAEELVALRLVDSERLRAAFASSLEAGTVPRRFTPRRWLLQQAIAKPPVDAAG